MYLNKFIIAMAEDFALLPELYFASKFVLDFASD